jgi:hypothetical protein
MERLNNYRMKMVLVGIGVAIVLGAGSAYADFTFSTPIELGPPIWSPGHDPQGCCFSRDGLELYFSSTRPGGYGFFDIWVATRETVNTPWGEPVNLGPSVNSPAGECDPAISPDGLELYFGIYNESPYRIRVCSRPSKDAPWSNPELLNPPVGDYEAFAAELSPDGLSLYFSSSRPGGCGGCDIFVSTRATTKDDWGIPVDLGPSVNSTVYDAYPSISSDGLALFFCSDLPGGYGNGDIWVATRPTTDAEWGLPVNYPSLNQPFDDDTWSPAISPDGSVLYFESIFNLWQSSITPIVDFNGDEIVDIQDLLKLIESWGKNDPSVDIGPMPWGDGIVDVNDLEVLMSYWQQEILPPELAAYWKLDETEGNIAHDNVGNNHGTVYGEPLWQPESGKKAGALQFDGIDDYADAGFVLNPSGGPFSVFAWIKGGAAGQVILSQEGGVNWLMADSVNGALRTDLKEPASAGRNPKPPGPPLICSTVVTDGDWHRVGFVRDGINRILYVDDVEVARDTAASLEAADGGMYIGAGSGLELGTFWSGLIDDVRIYNVTLSAEEIAALAQ